MDEERIITEEQETGQEEIVADENAVPSGRFGRILDTDARKFKLSGMFREWYLDYASYVILHRAVPHIVDGLKPVQRRVLHAMYKMDNGAYTKVANIVGQAMQYHPHGDQSILGALVTLGQKGYTIDCQGNWGNIFTGDSNAAPRYIEARLSKFAKEVVFDPDVTPYMNSYDGRNLEPTELPVRFPLLLAQGTEGIGVGLASKILPHNFNELIDASIAILEGRKYEIYPDFPTGGFADCSKYMNGRRGGFVKVRARIEKIDKNTVAITEIPYGKTTQLLIDSIMKAQDKKKIKIKKIEDMTTDKVNILIHLHNDVSPDKTIDALYAFTDCENNISPNACVIVDNKPQFLSVNEILEYSTFHTRDILQKEQELQLAELERQWHFTSLERIFFENHLYKILEQNQKTWQDQLNDIFKALKDYEDLLRRPVVMEDVEQLVEKPVRKISRFDTKVLDEKILKLEEEMRRVRDNLDNITAFTIEWFRSLKAKYGKQYPRLTELTGFEAITATKVINNNAKLYANYKEGFVGISLKKEEGVEYVGDCSDLSEVIVIARDGKYKIAKVEDKAFFWKDLIYVGVFTRNDERTIYNVIYRDGQGANSYVKRFAITSVTRDKPYDITQGEEGSQILWFTANHNGEAETVRVQLRPRAKLKKTSFEYDFSQLAVKGRTARGNLLSKNPISKITLRSKGVSTISGKDVWYDPDIQKLNEDSHGQYLGQFDTEDKVLAVFRNGTFYTTSFDLSNRYQGEVLRIEKFDPEKTFTALYYDARVKSFYVKRFSFVQSDNTPLSFIAEGQKSYLVDLSEDRWPCFEVIFDSKSGREPEVVDAEQWIGKKGYAAKGKKVSDRSDVKKVRFIEPLVKEEAEVPEDEDMPEDGDMAETAATAGTVEIAGQAGNDGETAPAPASPPTPVVTPDLIGGPVTAGKEEPLDISVPEVEVNPADIPDIEIEPTLF